MGQAGLQFVGQFEMQRVLADFENELLILAGETDRHPRQPEKPLPGR